MRIFYASDTTPCSFFKSNLWRNNLYMPLCDLGHEIIEFDYDLSQTFKHLDMTNPKHYKFIKANRPKLSNELLKQINKAHAENKIDLFFSYFYDACILPETVDEIKKLGIKTVNWYCNGSYQLYLVKEISPHYDYCLVPEKFRIDDYKKMGANPIYCQEAANPNIYKPYDIPYEYDVSFIGQAYGERPYIIKHLIDNNIEVKVFGWGWDKYTDRKFDFDIIGRFIGSQKVKIPAKFSGSVLSDEEMIKTYSKSKINLGFSSCGETHNTGERIVQVRLRDFEVPMSGGFYMVEYMEELQEFFEIEKEIVCYRNADELADKIKYYLSHDSEREQIRKAGHERCLKDHTWHRRFEKVFEQILIADNSVTLQ